MKQVFIFLSLLFSLISFSQDSTMNILTKGMDNKTGNKKMPVKIFESERLINANTTQMVGKGKMDFKVTHNFDDIVRNNVSRNGNAFNYRGGVNSFWGLDNSTDIRIGFHIGLTDRLDLSIARAKGDRYGLRADTVIDRATNPPPTELLPENLIEIGLKYQLLRQLENDPSHPISMAFFFNTAISTIKADRIFKLKDFKKFGDRMNQVLQLIIAKKFGKISAQLHPTVVHWNYVPDYEGNANTTFALGGAFRVPISRNIAIIVDYFHPFIQDKKEMHYYDSNAVKFHDPLGIGFEITTTGHVFHLNFTNTPAILENQFIPYTTTSWGKGQFRWGFTISRKFVLWREKSK